MKRSKIVAAICITLGLLAMAAPAQAKSLTVSDPAGDAAAPGLDITGVTFANRERAFVAAITFVADVKGTAIVAIGPRGGPLRVLISEHHSHGSDKTFLIGRRGQPIPCRDLSSSWDRASAALLLRVPSSCILDGRYGAVHSWVLTEASSSGQDLDWAPEGPNGEIRFTDWIPRG